MGIAGATVAAAGISAGAGLLGSSQQSSAIKEGAQKASMAQLYQQSLTRGDEAPYLTVGSNAVDQATLASGASGTQNNPLFQQNIVARMSGMLGPEIEAGSPVQNVAGQLSGVYGPEAAQAAMANFQTSPGYQFRMDQGLRGVDAAAASRGMLRSGATLKAENEYAQGLAADEYGKYFDRAGTQYGNYFSRASDTFGNYYNRLYDLARLGQNAAAGVGTAGTASANAMSNIATGAAGQEAGIAGNLASGLSRGVNSLFNNTAMQDWAKGLTAPSTSGGTGDATWDYSPAEDRW